MVTRHIVQLFKKNAINVTDARVRITAIIYNAGKWISLAAILRAVNNEFDRTTVYRVLCMLCDNGFLNKLVDIEKISYYMFSDAGAGSDKKQVQDQHEHTYFKCMSCGSISPLPAHDTIIHLPEGFTKTSSNLLISGYCDHCAPTCN